MKHNAPQLELSGIDSFNLVGEQQQQPAPPRHEAEQFELCQPGELCDNCQKDTEKYTSKPKGN